MTGFPDTARTVSVFSPHPAFDFIDAFGQLAFMSGDTVLEPGFDAGGIMFDPYTVTDCGLTGRKHSGTTVRIDFLNGPVRADGNSDIVRYLVTFQPYLTCRKLRDIQIIFVNATLKACLQYRPSE